MDSNISLREFEIFVATANSSSIRNAARRKKLLPAHVSKIIQRLEQKLCVKLFNRSRNGVLLTPEGQSLLPEIQDIVDHMHRLDLGHAHDRSQKVSRVYAVASISFLSTHFIPECLVKYRTYDMHARFRVIEFTHNQLVPFAMQGAFEIAVHIEPLPFPRSWVSHPIGRLSWNLYGSVTHKLKARSTQAEISRYPFVLPIDYSIQGFSIGLDNCPLSWDSRLKGFEAMTAETALEIVRRTDQLTFIPEVVARSYVKQGLVKEIQVNEWPEVRKDIFLSVRNELPQVTLKHLLVSARSALQ